MDNVRTCKILVSGDGPLSVCTQKPLLVLCGFVFIVVVVVLAFQGSGLHASSVLHGMVFKKETEGDVTSVKDAKIAVYSCPFDCMVTETKVSGFF